MKPYESIAIGLMSTGDEVVAGDIINKNACEIAHRLEARRFYVKTHLAVRDDMSSLIEGLTWLLSKHKVIVITGGLGPTIDDRTIDAVAAVLNREIEFDSSAWDVILSFYHKLGREAPEVAKRVARFVSGSIKFSPIKGTAHGSIVEDNGRHIVILPGPPRECLPIIDEHIIPYLKAQGLASWFHRKTYFLAQVGESQVASLIEPIAERLGIQLGFRASYPYLEVKCFIEDEDMDLSAIEAVLKPWWIADEPLVFEEVFLAYWAEHGATWSVQADGAEPWLSWLPGWAKQQGTNCLDVQYEASQSRLSTRLNGLEYVLNVPDIPDHLQHVLVKHWLCAQWVQALGLR